MDMEVCELCGVKGGEEFYHYELVEIEDNGERIYRALCLSCY